MPSYLWAESGVAKSRVEWRWVVDEMNMVETLPARIWLDRCARRISEIDEEIAEGEARRIARELHKFERTRAMEPEVAVEFVAAQLAHPGGERFERRSASRR
jgi:hypothetical protein